MNRRDANGPARIRPMQADDIPATDAVWRGAFSAFLGLPDPMASRPGANSVRTRYLTDPSGNFMAEVDGEVVGSNFAVNRRHFRTRAP